MAMCPVSPKTCGPFNLSNLKLHLNLNHPTFEINQKITCGNEHCKRPFDNWQKYRKHLREEHNVCNASENRTTPKIVSRNNVEREENYVEDADIVVSDESGRSIEQVKSHMRDVFLGFVAKLYSVPKIPRSFVQDMVIDIISLIHECICQVTSVTSDIVEYNDTTTIVCFKEILSVFREFSSEYRRLQILHKSGCYIKPETYVVGSEVKEKQMNGRIVKELTNLYGYMVPVRRVLECFFSMPGVFDEVMAYVDKLQTESFGILGNFIHGALWKFKVAKFFENKLVLPLNFYHDEYEINNPLGSHACLQKLGGTYFNIPCLPPEHRSQLANIFLALLTYASDRKSTECRQYRNAAIFKVLIDQINDLQRNGIVVESGGEKHVLHFGFGLLLGDNEGLNNCQDFASASTYCRFCKASSLDIKGDLYEKSHLLRHEEDYEIHVANRFEKGSGIKDRSVWNEIDGHHIYNNYSVDLLHDVEEGLLKYGMFHVVDHFVKKAKKAVSLEILNDRIKTFNYYNNGITNKPQLISDRDLYEEERLRMSGSEMHNFTLLFSMLVGDLVHFKDQVWDYYLLLRRILNILYAPEIQREFIDSFSELVAQHHKQYIKLFKDTLKVKHHNLVHYARVMKQSGPLCHLSTFRFEARHKPCKEAAAATSSRRDPALTVAIKDQLKLCYRLAGNHGFKDRFEIGPSYAISAGEQSYLNLPPHYGDFMEISWVESKGTRYRPNMCVCHSVNESDGLPMFGRIEKILCNENFKVYLYFKEFGTVGHDANLFAYEVFEERSFGHVLLNNLPIFSPAIFNILSNGSMYVTLRHAL